MRTTILAICLIPLLLSGCGSMMQAEYTRPEVTLPEKWQATQDEAATTAVASWPEDFSDSALARLIKLALKRNNDLAAATYRVRQAQLTAGLSYNELWPQLSAGGDSTNSKNLSNGTTTDSYSVNIGLSWEADLWGKLSRTHDADEWEALATVEDRQNTALSLVGTTMKLYWQIAYYNMRLALSQSNIDSSGETLQLIEAQEQFGAASELEVSQAEQDLASQQATYYDLSQSRQENINALAVLFDMPPGKTMADPQTLAASTIPEIPAGLPAEILSRRPDLRAAELRLRKLLANTDAAEASFYPTLSLTGTLGSSSTELATLLDNPVAALASSITLPFLNWNKLKLNLEVSKAEYDGAVASFRQTLYEAMQEVEDALSNRKNLLAKSQQLTASLEAAKRVERIYEVRYRAGSGTLKDWLDAQNTRRTAEETLAENTLDLLTNHVTLYQALGGTPKADAQHPKNS